MAEIAEQIPHQPSSSVNVIGESSECDEPMKKKPRLEKPPELEEENLEDRLNEILCCTVCLDLPTFTIYQCNNGHLMCAGCFTHLLADSRLKDEQPTCPNCRCEISKNLCSRNLAVEKAVSELPASCRYCTCKLPRYLLDQHERQGCTESSFFGIPNHCPSSDQVVAVHVSYMFFVPLMCKRLQGLVTGKYGVLLVHSSCRKHGFQCTLPLNAAFFLSPHFQI
nr:zinc finger TRAF-type-containing protein 1-like [Lytechinus pictus]